MVSREPQRSNLGLVKGSRGLHRLSLTPPFFEVVSAGTLGSTRYDPHSPLPGSDGVSTPSSLLNTRDVRG